MWKYACIGVLVCKIAMWCRYVQSLVSKINNFAIWQKKTWYVHVITFYLTEKSHLITFWIIFTQANNDLPIMTCAYTWVCYYQQVIILRSKLILSERWSYYLVRQWVMNGTYIPEMCGYTAYDRVSYERLRKMLSPTEYNQANDRFFAPMLSHYSVDQIPSL